MVTEDRPRVGVSSRPLGQESPDESRGAGLSTLGWESGAGSVLVVLTGCVTLGKSLGLSGPQLPHLQSEGDYSCPGCGAVGRTQGAKSQSGETILNTRHGVGPGSGSLSSVSGLLVITLEVAALDPSILGGVRPGTQLHFTRDFLCHRGPVPVPLWAHVTVGWGWMTCDVPSASTLDSVLFLLALSLTQRYAGKYFTIGSPRIKALICGVGQSL